MVLRSPPTQGHVGSVPSQEWVTGGGKEGTVPTLLEEWEPCASMERSMGPVSVWVGREGRDCKGWWAGRWLTVIGHGEAGI